MLAAAAFLLAAPVGCERVQTALSGKSDQGPALQALRQRIGEFRQRFSNATRQPDSADFGGIFQDAGSLLDAIEKQAGTLSFMDGQSVKIQVASARNLLRDARPFVDSGDIDGIRSAQVKLDAVLFDIDNTLDRAAMMTDNPQKTGS
jgi:hypothetical protein